MKRDTELALIDQALAQLASNTPHLADAGSVAPVSEYVCAQRFAKETTAVFRGFPVALANVDEIPSIGDYIVRELAGISIIITRCAHDVPRAFMNACRHRGSRLLSAPKGNARIIVCPYHAWSYRDGALARIPGAEGFREHDHDNLGLLVFPSTERFGLIWVQADPHSNPDWDAWFASVECELAELDLGSHFVYSVREVEVAANCDRTA